ncbi:MAG: chemotaxis-specific protein-glutamate methyltransferase CheB [Phycisphaerales bacterium]
MRIAIVNDLKLAVEVLQRVVAAIPGASVAWIAEDGKQAVEKCAQDRPDLILMDMLMPVMNGVEATRRIMAATPCPILVVTATVEGNSSKVFEALGAGALDAVETPGLGANGTVERAESLIRKVQMIRMIAGGNDAGANSSVALGPAETHLPTPSMVAIGASTGGPLVLAKVLKALPRPTKWPVVIVQHVDTQFAAGLASWLSSETGHMIRIITPDEKPAPGRIALAATGDHLILNHRGNLVYTEDPKEAAFRPSVDVFFESLTAPLVARGVAVVLTGMGRDGAIGMGKLKRVGWHTIAQDRESSVVWGMPGACVETGAAIEMLSANDIGAAIVHAMEKKGAGRG